MIYETQVYLVVRKGRYYGQLKVVRAVRKWPTGLKPEERMVRLRLKVDGAHWDGMEALLEVPGPESATARMVG